MRRFLHLAALAGKQVVRHRIRSLLTVAGVAAGMFLHTTVTTLQDAVGEATATGAKDTTLVVYRENRFCPATSRLPEHYAAEIRRLPGVAAAVPVQIVVNNCGASLDVITFRGVPPQDLASFNPDLGIIAGSFDAWAARSDGALLGEHFAARRGLKVGDQFEAVGVRVMVSGIVRSASPQDQSVAYVHLPFLQQSSRLGLGVVTQFSVKVDDPARLDAVASAIDETFRNDAAPTNTKPEKAFFAQTAKALVEMVEFTRWLGYGAVLSVLALVANALLLVVRGRVQENAVLQTIGFSRGAIGTIMLCEGAILGLLGGVVGSGTAWLFLEMKRFTLGNEGLSIALEPALVTTLGGLGLAVALGLLASLWPQSLRGGPSSSPSAVSELAAYPDMLPFAYAVRNLLRDPARLLQKAGGASLVVFLLFAAGSFNRGMANLLRASGSPRNVIFVGAGSEESVERSEVRLDAETQIAAGVRGISTRAGTSAVSGEVHYMGLVDLPGKDGARAFLRGIAPAAFEVHREVRLLAGVYPRSGEAIVGRLAARTLGVEATLLRPGAIFRFEGEEITISGVFEAPGTVMESEIWMGRTDLMAHVRRDALSCVVVRLESEDGYNAADLFAKQRLDLELVAIRESDYYAKLSTFYGPIRAMAWLTAALVAAGAVFGGINVLYAAFSSRIRELATLQAIGFSRPAILLSLVQETLVSTLLGTLAASFLAIALLEGVSVPFSIGTFELHLAPPVLLLGLGAGLILGIFGAFPPALRCLAAPLPTALRSQ